MKICVLENAIWFNGCFMSMKQHTQHISVFGVENIIMRRGRYYAWMPLQTGGLFIN